MAASERPVTIAAPAGELLAIVAAPAGPANGLALVQLRGAGWRPSSGPRRTQVRLARRMATVGFHAVRFSYRGTAESTGETVDIVRLDQPFVDDVAAVTVWVRGRGLRPVLVGNCFGARTALAHVAATPDDVAGLVLLVPPVHDFEVARRLEERPPRALARRATPARLVAVLRDPTRRRALRRTVRALLAAGRRRVVDRHGDDPTWLSAPFCRQLATVTGRGVPVLMVYGDEDQYGRDFATCLPGRLGEVVTHAGPTLSMRTVPGLLHGLTSVATQETMLDVVESWLRDLPEAAPGA